MAETLHEAHFWEATTDSRVTCNLCPQHCTIAPGRTGVCGVRQNQGGRLYALTFGRPSAVHVDPIEKKPLFHFLPGTQVLSLGTAGCNLSCRWCQNWDISRAAVDDVATVSLTPDRVVGIARAHGCPSIAFTYNEPTVFAEYVIHIAARAREAGLKTVMVTNGYMSKPALYQVYENIDAANVDLKGFSDDIYRSFAGGFLRPVLDALVALAAMGVWLELTTLLIDGLNADPERLHAQCRWIRENLGPDVPLHFSAFHPDHEMKDRPRTRPETLRMARSIALDEGLHYVYEGNVQSDGANTLCPGCGRVVVRRSWHDLLAISLREDNRCECGQVIPMRR